MCVRQMVVGVASPLLHPTDHFLDREVYYLLVSQIFIPIAPPPPPPPQTGSVLLAIGSVLKTYCWYRFGSVARLESVSSVAAIYREMRYIAIKPLYRETRYIAINIYSFRGDFHHTCLRESAQLNRLKRPNTGKLKEIKG